MHAAITTSGRRSEPCAANAAAVTAAFYPGKGMPNPSSLTNSAFFFSSRRRHTRFKCDWSSDVCSSDLIPFFAISWSPSPFPCERTANHRATLGQGRPLRRARVLPLHDRAHRRTPAGAVFRRRRRAGPDCSGRHFRCHRVGHRGLGRRHAGSHPGEAHPTPLARLQHAIPDHTGGVGLSRRVYSCRARRAEYRQRSPLSDSCEPYRPPFDVRNSLCHHALRNQLAPRATGTYFRRPAGTRHGRARKRKADPAFILAARRSGQNEKRSARGPARYAGLLSLSPKTGQRAPNHSSPLSPPGVLSPRSFPHRHAFSVWLLAEIAPAELANASARLSLRGTQPGIHGNSDWRAGSVGDPHQRPWSRSLRTAWLCPHG